MTISTASLSKAGPFLGNGVTTSFPFAFKTFAADQLKVTFTNTAGVESVLVLNSNYTVTLNVDQDTSPGGTVTYPVTGTPLAGPSGPLPAERLTITGATPATQETDLTNGGPWNPTVIENSLDKLTLLIQQLLESDSRTLVLPVSDSAAALTLPTAAVRANQFLAFDASGNPFAAASPTPGAFTVSAFWQTVLDDTTVAQSLFDLGLYDDATTPNVLKLFGSADPGWGSNQNAVHIAAQAAIYSSPVTTAPDEVGLASNLRYDNTSWFRISAEAGALARVTASSSTPQFDVYGAVTGTAGSVAPVFEILRATPGLLQVNGNASFSAPFGIGAGAALVANATSSNTAAMILARGGLARGVVYTAGTESGSDSGGDLFLGTYTDAGAFKEIVMSFSRATGLGTVKGDPTTGLGIATKQYADAVAFGATRANVSMSVNMSGVADGNTATGAEVGVGGPYAVGEIVYIGAHSVSQVTATAGGFFHSAILVGPSSTAVLAPVNASNVLLGIDQRQVTTGPASNSPWTMGGAFIVTTGGTLFLQVNARNNTGAAGTNTVTWQVRVVV